MPYLNKMSVMGKAEARIISQLAKEVDQAEFTTQAQQKFDDIKSKTVDINQSENMERN
ncbi:hypothetical protein [Neisseria sp. Ec49-e6-T10]|uniref:hypothetical protein n=1 Tax=Neisseria sp. Ec49-e6-T10 TaxID=3140744 RepID=UPI003EBBD791